MKKILMLSTFCYNNASANGLCARALREAFQKLGHQVYLVGYGEQTSKFDVGENHHEFTVRHDEENMYENPKSKDPPLGFVRLKSIITPRFDRDLVMAYHALVKEMHKRIHFDIVISMYFPIELIAVASKLKKKNPSIQYIIYELDSATDGISRYGRLSKLIGKAYQRWLGKQYRLADMVCVMQSHAQHMINLYGRLVKGKACVLDIPVLSDLTKQNAPPRKTPVSFFYTGRLETTLRPPEFLLKLFESSGPPDDWSLHFFSKGNCEAQIREASERDARIVQHGYVSSEILEEGMQKADIFVNIGNSRTNNVPSKAIAYLSYGKPIIHITLQENDVCEAYFEKYPLALILKNSDSVEDCRKELWSFVENNAGRRVAYNVIESNFRMNTPCFSAKTILDKIDRK